jgi:hypothetical protein
MNETPDRKTPARNHPAKKTRGLHSIQGGTTEANRQVIVILEVLAGSCSPAEAATRMGISLPRYYQLETRALEGMVRACEPKPLGKQPSAERRIAALEKQLQHAQRQCARQQALVRVTQRSAGLSLPAKADKPSAPTDRRGRKKRRPTVRALKAVAVLQEQVAFSDTSAIQQELPATGTEEPSSAWSATRETA